jgi:cell wall-associated NlpC family hydrolase
MESRGVVIGGVVNVYGEPRVDVEVVSQAVLGTELAIEESRKGWYYARMPDDYRGWIEAAWVRVHAPGEGAYPATAQVAEIQSLLAFLYHAPFASARAPALQVTLGVRLEAGEEREGWVQVVLPDASARWVQRGHVALLAADAPRSRGSVEAVLTTAKRFLGLPYLWGGTTPLGIDCSGFVQLVYRQHGVHLVRDSHLQYTQPGLTPVGRAGLQAGDLLFFGRERITHVGLCMGDGAFIHATTHKWPVVQVSRLDETHWTSLYRGARRP